MTKRKTIYTILAVVLVCCIAVAGTLAYLTAKTTEEVKNTFTASSPKLVGEFDLKEHVATADAKGVYSLSKTELTNSNSYKVLPGVNLPKDPFISISGKTEVASYLYVEVVDNLGANSGLSYALTSDWTKLELKGANGGDVYVYQNGLLITDKNAPTTVSILKGNVVTVGQDVNVGEDGVDITFYGYMAQASAGADAAAAYTACFNNTTEGE